MFAEILIHLDVEAMAEQSRTAHIRAAREGEEERKREREEEHILPELVVVFLVYSTVCLVSWMVPSSHVFLSSLILCGNTFINKCASLILCISSSNQVDNQNS